MSYRVPPAVAADQRIGLPPQARAITSSHTPTAPADVAGGRGNPSRFAGSVVGTVAPCEGWELYSFRERDGDGFETPAYFAHGPDCDVLLDVSRFFFDPTQARFDWLVRAGFPDGWKNPLGGVLMPWNNDEIDAEIARQREAA